MILFDPARDKIRQPVQFLAVILFISIIAYNGQATEYAYNIPPALSDGWEVASLESVGIDTKAIESMTDEMIGDDRYSWVLSVLIVKDGKLVHEAYSPYCQRNTLHALASITKTFTSTLIGIAIDKGFIESVDTKALDLLPEFADAVKDQGLQKITLEHLMTMSSGLSWCEKGYSYNHPKNSEYRMVESEDWMRYVLSNPMADPPGSRFYYNTGGIHLLSAVIKNATGLYINRFAEDHLLHPMGILAYQWNRDPMGYPCTGGTDGGIGLRTRDLAKLGWLFLKDGRWKGKKIISCQWISTATKKHRKTSYGKHYGYNWFPGSKEVNGKSFDYTASFGYGGQTLYLVPEFDLILIFTCELRSGNGNVHELVERAFEAIIR